MGKSCATKECCPTATSGSTTTGVPLICSPIDKVCVPLCASGGDLEVSCGLADDTVDPPKYESWCCDENQQCDFSKFEGCKNICPANQIMCGTTCCDISKDDNNNSLPDNVCLFDSGVYKCDPNEKPECPDPDPAYPGCTTIGDYICKTSFDSSCYLDERIKCCFDHEVCALYPTASINCFDPGSVICLDNGGVPDGSACSVGEECCGDECCYLDEFCDKTGATPVCKPDP